MHGLKTLERINQEAEEAPRERDFLIGYHGDVAIITPLKTKSVQWAFREIKNHLGREGIAYVVDRKVGEGLEALIRTNGFRVN